MPKSNLDAVIGRALRDEEFRKNMISNPDAIAGEYGLSEGELGQLKSISQEAADQFFNQVAGGAAMPCYCGSCGQCACSNCD